MQYVSWLQVELFTLANHVISSFFASMNCERSWKSTCIGKQTCMSKHFWLFCQTNLQSSLCLGRHSWTAEQLSNELSLTSLYMVSSFSIFWKLIKYSIYKDKNLFLVQGEKLTDPHTCSNSIGFLVVLHCSNHHAWSGHITTSWLGCPSTARH